jgi:hypothetical protein
MNWRENLNYAVSAHFIVSNIISQPSGIGIAFANYSLPLEIFKKAKEELADQKLTLEIKQKDITLQLDFINQISMKTEFSAELNYESGGFRNFISKVSPQLSFVVAFGFEPEGRFVVAVENNQSFSPLIINKYTLIQ